MNIRKAFYSLLQSEQAVVFSTLLYLRARYYDPALGTFLNKDPVLGVPGYSQTLKCPAEEKTKSTEGTDSGTPESQSQGAIVRFGFM